jgi:acyl-CoA synthetase (NDP forming)
MKALRPERVVLIGSSSMTEEIGMTAPELFRGIQTNMGEFKGEVTVLDVDAPSPLEGDLAVIALPPDVSLEWAERCGEAGVPSIIQITGGFSMEQRRRYRELIDTYGFRLLGPNSIMGYLDTGLGLNTTFNEGIVPARGPASFIVQSGGVGAAVLDTAISEGCGISRFAFVGDKIDIDDEDLLLDLLEDPETKAIGMYVEGVKDGRSFVDTASKVTAEKPIVALKGGISKEGARRARSHTASVSGSDDIFEIALKEAGIIRVPSIQSLIHTSVALAHQPPLEGRRIAIVSNVGGPAILGADAVVRAGLQMARPDPETAEKVSSKYPGVEMINPIDLIADADGHRYNHVLRAVLDDDNVDGVIVINQMKSCFFREEDVDGILGALAGSTKTVVDVIPGGTDFRSLRGRFIEAGIPAYTDPSHAVEALEALHNYSLVLRGEYA